MSSGWFSARKCVTWSLIIFIYTEYIYIYIFSHSLTCCCTCWIFSLSSFVLASSSLCSVWIFWSFPTSLLVKCWSSKVGFERRVRRELTLRCWFNSLSLEFLELSSRAGQRFCCLLLSQLLYLCLQGSQLLLQSLWDKNWFRQELKQGQHWRTTWRKGLLKSAKLFILIQGKGCTSTVFSLAELLSWAACRLSSTIFSFVSFSWILWSTIK